jgi:hypothetical protein
MLSRSVSLSHLVAFLSPRPTRSQRRYGNVRCTTRPSIGAILGLAAGICKTQSIKNVVLDSHTSIAVILISFIIYGVSARRRRMAQRTNLSYLQNQPQAVPMGGYYPPQPQYPATGTGYFQGTPSGGPPPNPGQTFDAPPGQTFGTAPSQTFDAPPGQTFGAAPGQTFGAAPGQTFGAPADQTFNVPPGQPPDFQFPTYYPPPTAPPPQQPTGDKGSQSPAPLQAPPPTYQQPSQKTG